MAEIFPAGFIGLKDCITRETALRFGAENSEDLEKCQTIFDEMCRRLYAEWQQHRWAKAFMPDGKRVDVPADVWMRPAADRQEIAATGQIAKFWSAADRTYYCAGRVVLPAGFTLVSAPVRKETEAEKIARQARAQAAGRSIGSLAGSPPSWTTQQIEQIEKMERQGNGSRSGIDLRALAQSLPIIDVPVEWPATSAVVKKPAVQVQKRQVKAFMAKYAAALNGGEKPTIGKLIAAAKADLGYQPARARITEALDDHPQLKRAPGEHVLKPKPAAQ